MQGPSLPNLYSCKGLPEIVWHRSGPKPGPKLLLQIGLLNLPGPIFPKLSSAGVLPEVLLGQSLPAPDKKLRLRIAFPKLSEPFAAEPALLQGPARNHVAPVRPKTGSQAPLTNRFAKLVGPYISEIVIYRWPVRSFVGPALPTARQQASLRNCSFKTSKALLFPNNKKQNQKKLKKILSFFFDPARQEAQSIVNSSEWGPWARRIKKQISKNNCLLAGWLSRRNVFHFCLCLL